MSAELIQIEEARALVLGDVTPLGTERCPLDAAVGRVLAEDAVAPEDVPGFDNSAMDGFAVIAAEIREASAATPVELAVIGESRAGRPATQGLKGREAIAISTGAVVPEDADAVVRVEDTEAGATPGTVRVLAAAGAGKHMRRAGDDIRAGEVVLRAGHRLGPAELGVLASVGVAEPLCAQRPRVAVLSTGDELIGPGDPMQPGGVRNSNAYTVPALAEAAGADVVHVVRVADDPEATRTALGEALDSADVLVVCGGVSVGEHDHVKAAFAELGVEQRFWGVSLKPGRPTWFGRRDTKLAFGLPGNPVSAMVTFILFTRPALLAMQGADPEAVRISALLAESYEKPTDRAHAIRCRLEATTDGLLAHPAPRQGSHVLTSMLGADGLAMIGESTAMVEAGELVTVELLGGAGAFAPSARP